MALRGARSWARMLVLLALLALVSDSASAPAPRGRASPTPGSRSRDDASRRGSEGSGGSGAETSRDSSARGGAATQAPPFRAGPGRSGHAPTTEPRARRARKGSTSGSPSAADISSALAASHAGFASGGAGRGADDAAAAALYGPGGALATIVLAGADDMPRRPELAAAAKHLYALAEEGRLSFITPVFLRPAGGNKAPAAALALGGKKKTATVPTLPAFLAGSGGGAASSSPASSALVSECEAPPPPETVAALYRLAAALGVGSGAANAATRWARLLEIGWAAGAGGEIEDLLHPSAATNPYGSGGAKGGAGAAKGAGGNGDGNSSSSISSQHWLVSRVAALYEAHVAPLLPSPLKTALAQAFSIVSQAAAAAYNLAVNSGVFTSFRAGSPSAGVSDSSGAVAVAPSSDSFAASSSRAPPVFDAAAVAADLARVTAFLGTCSPPAASGEDSSSSSVAAETAAVLRAWAAVTATAAFAPALPAPAQEGEGTATATGQATLALPGSLAAPGAVLGSGALALPDVAAAAAVAAAGSALAAPPGSAAAAGVAGRTITALAVVYAPGGDSSAVRRAAQAPHDGSAGDADAGADASSASPSDSPPFSDASWTVRPSMPHAMRAYSLGAALGNPDARYTLAVAHSLGLFGASHDPALAHLHLHYAAEAGSLEASHALGHRHEHGIGTEANCLVALDHYQPVADHAAARVAASQGLLQLVPGPLLRRINNDVLDVIPGWPVAGSYSSSSSTGGDSEAAGLQEALATVEAGAARLFREEAAASSGNATANSAPLAAALAALSRLEGAVAGAIPRAGHALAHFFSSKAGDLPLGGGTSGLLRIPKGWPDPSALSLTRTFLHDAADRGSAEAELLLGQSYLLGLKGADTDPAVAAEHFAAAAEAGNPYALHSLGLMHQHGFGVPADAKLAAAFLNASVAAGHGVAANELGVLALYGGLREDGKPDPNAAYRYFKMASGAGSGDALFNLGLMALSPPPGLLADPTKDGPTGSGSDAAPLARRSFSVAFAFFMSAAKRGHLRGLHAIAAMVRARLGPKTDCDVALASHHAVLGHMAPSNAAENGWALLRYYNNPEAAVLEWARAAEAGREVANWNAAFALHHGLVRGAAGEGTAAGSGAGASSSSAGAAASSSTAPVPAATAPRRRGGVVSAVRDATTAVLEAGRTLLRAAGAVARSAAALPPGSAAAAPGAHVISKRLYRRSASASKPNPLAVAALGDFALHGWGGGEGSAAAAPDAVAAAAFYSEACNSGIVPDACYNLGYLYETGTGVVPDTARARRFYRLALGTAATPDDDADDEAAAAAEAAAVEAAAAEREAAAAAAAATEAAASGKTPLPQHAAAAAKSSKPTGSSGSKATGEKAATTPKKAGKKSSSGGDRGSSRSPESLPARLALQRLHAAAWVRSCASAGRTALWRAQGGVARLLARAGARRAVVPVAAVFGWVRAAVTSGEAAVLAALEHLHGVGYRGAPLPPATGGAAKADGSSSPAGSTGSTGASPSAQPRSLYRRLTSKRAPKAVAEAEEEAASAAAADAAGTADAPGAEAEAAAPSATPTPAPSFATTTAPSPSGGAYKKTKRTGAGAGAAASDAADTAAAGAKAADPVEAALAASRRARQKRERAAAVTAPLAAAATALLAAVDARLDRLLLLCTAALLAVQGLRMALAAAAGGGRQRAP